MRFSILCSDAAEMSLLFFKKLNIYTLGELKIWTTKLIMGEYFLRVINQKIFKSIKCLL